MRNNQKIEQMEERLENLVEKVRELKKSQEEKDKLLDFLSQYNKDEVVFDIKSCFMSMELIVNYVYNGELKEYNFGFYSCLVSKRVVSNKNLSAIIEIGEDYYKLDKAQNIVVDITDIYKPKAETKKPSTKTTKTTKKK